MAGKRTIVVVLFFLFLLLGLFAAGGVMLYAIFQGGSPSIESGSVFVCDLRRELTEVHHSSIQDAVFGNRPVNLTETVYLLRAAAEDDRIERVVVRAGGIASVGWGKAEEIRNAVLAIRAAGKPVEVHMDATLDLPYYISTAASKIVLAPAGMLLVDGMYAEVQFLKNLFGKADIEWEAVTAGKYKSYPETYIKDSMSEPYREQIDALLDARYETYLEAIAEGRGMTYAEASAVVSAGPYTIATEALEAGLVDELLFWSDYERLLDIHEDGETMSFGLEEYRDAGALDPGFASEGVAVVFITGDIMPGPSESGYSRVAGSETITESILKAADDGKITAIVLRVSSPGGSVMASDEIWRAVESAKMKKPVVVSMGDVAASGGYWVSAGADAILADRSTVTGSIGVFALRPTWDGLYDRLGIHIEEFTRGENAGTFRSSDAWSESEREKIQRGIDHSYREFLTRVSLGRNIAVADVDKIAGGRVWSGGEAYDLGLVDRIGGVKEAVSLALELAELDPEEAVRLHFYPEERTFWEKLRDGDFLIRESFTNELKTMLAEYGIPAPAAWQMRSAAREFWAVMPFREVGE